MFGVAEGGTLTVKNGTVKGGGFNVNGKLTLDSVAVTGNSAQDAGGGIYVGGGTGPELYLEGTLTVTDNKAAGARSDIFLFAGKKNKGSPERSRSVQVSVCIMMTRKKIHRFLNFILFGFRVRFTLKKTGAGIPYDAKAFSNSGAKSLCKFALQKSANMK